MKKSSLLTDRECRIVVQNMKKIGVSVAVNEQAGTVVAKYDDAEVFRAIQMGYGGNWIATFKDGPNLNWTKMAA